MRLEFQKARVKWNGGHGALLCNFCDKTIRTGFNLDTIEDKFHYCKGDYCDLQKNCKYGYVFPDHCRYTRHLGCDCGAYPAIECQATFKEHCTFPKCDCDRK